MKRIEAQTLEEAYAQATKVFDVSINELDIEVIQNPSKGFLGMMKKTAVLLVDLKDKNPEEKPVQTAKTPSFISEKTEELKHSIENIPHKIKSHAHDISESVQKVTPNIKKVASNVDKKVFDSFFQDKEVTAEKKLEEIESEIKRLMGLTCFEIDTIKVRYIDKTTIEVFLDGIDSALLIGKEGYRYKAISYLLFNWINAKYSYQVRLEIAEFYKNQTQMVCKYLETIYPIIDEDGKVETKVFDGVLLQIALSVLREKYRDKYVAIRSNSDGLKYIIVNSFYSKKS
jgi:spoIIIJ-associated protein